MIRPIDVAHVNLNVTRSRPSGPVLHHGAVSSRSMTTITVRPATETDAAAACEVLRRSIRELCAADHGHDEKVLSAWLANKTPENVRAWITDPSSFSVVAVEGAAVRGFAMVRRDGEVQLCYLVPEIQYRGAGKRMLGALEAHAAQWGLTRVFLTSSVTAKAFYERNGYAQSGDAKSMFGLRAASPMVKSIGG